MYVCMYVCMYVYIYIYIDDYIHLFLHLNPLDPNPAISAHAVFPQSGHIRPEKRPFFKKIPHFSKLEPAKKYLPHTGVQYIKLKPVKFPVQCKGNDFVLIDICVLVIL